MLDRITYNYLTIYILFVFDKNCSYHNSLQTDDSR